MQKKVLAAALGGLLIAPAAFADVTAYGLVDIGVQLADPGDTYDGSETFVADTMGTGGSRLGFRANEDLGGGLSALATMELGWSTDDGVIDNAVDVGGSDRFKIFQRQVWAGLAGGFGRVTLGRQYRETFLTGTVGSYNYTGSGTGVFFLNANTGVRQDNLIKYTSPALAPGLTLVASYAPGEGGTAATEDVGEFSEFAIKWSSGPLALAAAVGSSTVAAGTDVDTTIVGGNFALSPATKFYALYSATDDVRTAMSLGASQRFGNHVLAAFFGTSEDDTVAGDNESTLIGVRYENWLSKSTNLFLTYGGVSNDTGVLINAPRLQAGGTAGEDNSAISAGAVFRF